MESLHEKNLKRKIGHKIRTRGELIDLGVSRHQIEELLKSGDLRQPKHGYYRLSEHGIYESDFCEEAFLITGKPSYICLWSALSLYGLTDEIPQKPWITVKWSKKSSSKAFKFVRPRHTNFEIGIDKDTFPFWISTVERTIVDCLMHPRYISKIHTSECFHQALKNKETAFRPSNLYDIARKLRAKDSVLDTIRFFETSLGLP